MIREAEKYLGYPYVWGGSSPSTSFDCSGFVSWVINHCGNGWNVGRLTASGLMNHCSIIRPSEAKPGDLIFFQGTYNTSGASHVGIYVGNGMMIHCGNPISYQVLDFRQKYRNVLDKIRQEHGESVTIHLYPATPNPINFEIGKGIMKNLDPTIILYDKTSGGTVYREVMCLHKRIRE